MEEILRTLDLLYTDFKECIHPPTLDSALLNYIRNTFVWSACASMSAILNIIEEEE